MEELKSQLSGEGVLRTKTGFPFVLQTEISSVYFQGGKTRKIHQVVLAPSFEAVDQITEELKKHGRVDYDGRPTFGLSAPEIVEIVMSVDRMCEVIPAHIWTPWFSLFGSRSGFDSIKECYGGQLKDIHAIETGLSSDPPMNWRLSQLDSMSIISSSDSHSFWPWRIGREATAYSFEPDYNKLIRAIRSQNIEYTIEVDPRYGKYFLDGHRGCGIVLTPQEAEKCDNICPACGKPLTIGVMHRVEELADRPAGYQPKNRPGYKTLLPLSELIAAASGFGIATKKSWEYYSRLTAGASEMQVLLEMPEQELLKRTHPKIVAAIMANRAGTIPVKGGYDGVYGEAQLDGISKQKRIGDY